MTNRFVVNMLLIAALIWVCGSFATSYVRSIGTGTFSADHYYLPLREYVDESQHREMENVVIKLYDEEQTHGSMLALVFHAVPLVCLLTVFWLVNFRAKWQVN